MWEGELDICSRWKFTKRSAICFSQLLEKQCCRLLHTALKIPWVIKLPNQHSQWSFQASSHKQFSDRRMPPASQSLLFDELRTNRNYWCCHYRVFFDSDSFPICSFLFCWILIKCPHYIKQNACTTISWQPLPHAVEPFSAMLIARTIGCRRRKQPNLVIL